MKKPRDRSKDAPRYGHLQVRVTPQLIKKIDAYHRTHDVTKKDMTETAFALFFKMEEGK